MTFVEEIVVDAFIPTVRSLLAEELSTRGLTQREIAGAIGVSQSAVSKYVHGEVTRHPEIVADERVRERVDELAVGLAANDLDPVGALIELEVLIRELEAPGDLLSRLHEEAVPGLSTYDAEFRVHDPDSRVRRREWIRASVRRAIRRIEETPEFVRLLPQVGANVIEVTPTGDSIGDVVGVPGRIIDVEGRVLIPGDPEFGVSGHLASILLAARDAGSDQRAAINVRYEAWIVDHLATREHDVIEIPGDDDVPAAVRAHVAEAPTATVIAQTGGRGIEPITYVLASDAPAAVEAVIDILDR